jgi:hypothetical protein
VRTVAVLHRTALPNLARPLCRVCCAVRSPYGLISPSPKESRTCYDEHYHKKWVPYRGRSRRKLWLVRFPRRLGPSGAFR